MTDRLRYNEAGAGERPRESSEIVGTGRPGGASANPSSKGATPDQPFARPGGAQDVSGTTARPAERFARPGGAQGA